MEKTRIRETKQRMKTLDMVYIAIGSALITVCSWISIPATVPFTLQTFAVFAVLLIFGADRGTMAVVVYVLMGAIGLPVFSGFRGGPGFLFGSTGGYIIGFIFIGLICKAFTKICGRKLFIEVTALVSGLIVCYAFGTGWFMYVYIRDAGEVSLLTVLSWCVFPFIVPDLIKLALAVFISGRVRVTIHSPLDRG